MKELTILKEMIEQRRPKERPMNIAVDFDGTLCTNQYPNIGKPNEALFALLKQEFEKGSEIILWTCRTGTELADAGIFVKEHLGNFFFINENSFFTMKRFGSDGRKIFADIYIDDRSMNREIIWGEEETNNILKIDDANRILLLSDKYHRLATGMIEGVYRGFAKDVEVFYDCGNRHTGLYSYDFMKKVDRFKPDLIINISNPIWLNQVRSQILVPIKDIY